MVACSTQQPLATSGRLSGSLKMNFKAWHLPVDNFLQNPLGWLCNLAVNTSDLFPWETADSSIPLGYFAMNMQHLLMDNFFHYSPDDIALKKWRLLSFAEKWC